MSDIFSGGGFGWAQAMAMVIGGQAARLGATVMPAAAKNTDIISWGDAYDILVGFGGIAGYAGADAASVRVGITPGEPGVIDSGNNYWWRSLFVPTGGVVLTDNPAASTSLMQLGEKTAQDRIFSFVIWNFLGRNKLMMSSVVIGSANAATIPDMGVAVGGQYFNTDAAKARIQCLQLVTLTNAMRAGSQFSLYGLNATL